MIGRILCRLGWHSWKPVFDNFRVCDAYGNYFYREMQCACICRRCRKRVSV